MTRSDILQAATACVTADRNRTYGPPEDSFAVIGQYWSTYLGVPVGAAQVGTLLALMKIARLQANPGHADSYVDLAGYAACTGGIATEALDRDAKASEELRAAFVAARECHLSYPPKESTIFTTPWHTWCLEERNGGFYRLWQQGAERMTWDFGDRESAINFAVCWEKPIPEAEWHARNAASRTQQTAPDPERGGWRDTVSYEIPVSAVVPQFKPDTIAVVCADEEPLNPTNVK